MINHPQIPTDNGFLTSLGQMKHLFSKGCQQRFAGETVQELETWQAKNRELFKGLLGFDTFEPCDNNLYELERVDCGSYTRVKYVLQTEAMVYMPFYALVPNDIKPGEKRPSVICPHGHVQSMKESIAGIRSVPGVPGDIKEFNTQYGEDFVKMGYIAFCPDARGFGERAEKIAHADDQWKCSCQVLNRMAIPLGRCAIGMSIWDLVKLTDYIHTRPDCDPDRIGCGGLSGGGLQTLYLAAVDTRIKCACTSGYFYGILESLLEQNNNCACNYTPNLWQHFDMCDIAGLIAPRAFIVEAGLQDGLNGRSGIDNVKSQYDITKAKYDVAGAGDKIMLSLFDVGHKWVGIDVYPFFDKHS